MMPKYVHPSTYLSFPRTVRLGFLALLVSFLTLWAQIAHAQIALGQSRTFSSIGQPLNATIDIQASPQDLASLRGRSYRIGAGGGVDPTITTRIVAGPTGAMVQLGSLVPVNDPFVDVVVELVSDTGASIARSFTMLINPNTGYSAPPIYRVPAANPHTRRKVNTTRQQSAVDPISQIDRQIAAAKRKLDALEAKINQKNAQASAPPPIVNANPATPADATANAPDLMPAPSPSSSENPGIPVDGTPQKLDIPPPSEMLNGAINAMNGAINTIAAPTPAVPPPTVAPTVTPPVPAPAVKPKPAVPRPVVAAVPPTPETGLFGLDFLPSAESLGIGGISNEIIMAGGGGLVVVSIIIGFLIWRRKRGRSSRKSTYMRDTDQDFSGEDVGAIFGGASDVFASEAAAPMVPESHDTPMQESENEKPKKKSFLSKFKRKKKETEDTAESAEENLDFAAMVAASQGKADDSASEKNKPKKAKAAESNANETHSKIERFVEDKGDQDDDYAGDLAHLSQMPTTQEEPTILVSKTRDNTSVQAGSPPTKMMPKAEEKVADVQNFTDKITRINPVDADDDADNIASTAFSEMLTEEPDEPMEVVRRKPPAPAKQSLSDDSFAETKSAKLMEDVTTELSIDDLDFSSEKTMIMPSLTEMVKVSDEAAAAKTDDFEFKLDLGDSGKTKPNTAVKGISQETPEFNTKPQRAPEVKAPATESHATLNVPSMDGFDLPDLSIPEMKAPAATKLAAPATQAPAMPDLDMPDFSLPDLDAPVAAAKPAAPAKLSVDAPGMDFEIPDLELPDLSMHEGTSHADANQSKAAPKKDNASKGKTEESAAGMMNFADLDLSSIKLD